MNRYDRAAIDQIIAKLEKINDFTELYDDCIGTLLVEINELKDSVDERVESVSDYGISQTENNQKNQEASDELDEIIRNLENLLEKQNEIQNAIDTLENL